MALSGSPWHSGWARRAGGAQLREAEVQASGGPVSRPWRRTGRGWKDLADRELKPRTQRFMRGSRSQHAEAREGATDRGQARDQESQRHTGKGRRGQGAATLGGVTEGAGHLQAAASPGTCVRHATPSSEAPVHRAHGDSRAQVSAPARWEQVWGRQGRCAAHLGGPRREGPGGPSSRPGS